MTYEAVIGLEIHAELKTRTKMFCDSLNDPDEVHPNVNICPICMGHPGTLPVINREAVQKVLQAGLALHGTIAAFSQFDRKNYFYPDLPKGYQISQYQHPLVRGGFLEIEVPTESVAPEIPNSKIQIPNKSKIQNSKFQTRRIRIQRVHLEEDTGRLIHVGGPSAGSAGSPQASSGRPATLVDFNRAGIPLMELVTEPDLRSPEEARLFAEELKMILQYLDASDADMEKGEMRIEANVSLRPQDSRKLGTKVELKNINSFRFVEKAIAYEIERQRGLLERGETVRQETRGWDATKGMTVPQRLKEESQDYRYFPEPDLPPLSIKRTLIEELRAALPELPAEKLRRFREEFAIDSKLAEIITRDRRLASFFEKTVSELEEWRSARSTRPDDSRSLQLAANYLTTDLAKLLADASSSIQESLVTPENFAELITYISEGRLSSRAAKEVLAEMFASGADPSVVIEERGLWQVSEPADFAATVARIVAVNPKAAADYRSGKAAALQFLLGQVMKEAKGANPEVIRKFLEEKLQERA